MSKGIIQTVEGAALIAAGVAATLFGAGPLGHYLITAGAGLVISGIGTMLAKGPLSGFSTTIRNPVAPWEIVYGSTRVGGTIVYINHWGDQNKFLDLVIVVAAHQCEAVDYLFFDNQLIQIDTNHAPSGSVAGTGTSFNPDIAPENILQISRGGPGIGGGVVTVWVQNDIPFLTTGTKIQINHNNNGGILDTYAATGSYIVTVIGRSITFNGVFAPLIFTYLSPGVPFQVNNEGQVLPQWANYYRSVYFEPLLGNQTLGQTFQGMQVGTQMGGVGGNPAGSDQGFYLYQYNDPASLNVNPWTPDCSCVGKTLVHLRLLYTPTNYPGGIPQISFQVRGRNQIFDSRSSSYGYTNNWALCVADYLNHPVWGFKALYGTEIDTTALTVAANISDEQVQVSVPYVPLDPITESRYTCNGKFNLAMRRGEILQNLLTAGAGRIVYINGKFTIYAAAWTGVTVTVDSTWVMSNSTEAIDWRPLRSISDTYNGVKGTFISPVNNWQSTDFPRYAQDSEHGYNDGSPADDYDLNLTVDGGDRRWLDVQFPFTTSCDTAQRLAKIELLRRRRQGTGKFQFNMYGYQITAIDVLAMSLDYLGWSAKTLEVLAARLRADKQGDGDKSVVVLKTEIDVQETDSFVYDWELIEDLTPQGYQVPGIPNTLKTPDPPTNLHVIYDDTGRSVLVWTPPTDAYVTTIAGRYQLITSPEGIWVSLGQVDVSVTQIALPTTLVRGSMYTLSLQSINVAGVQSGWVSIIFTAASLPPQWGPYQVRGDASDALFSDEYTFDVTLSYSTVPGNRTTLKHGAVRSTIVCKGVMPVDLTLSSPPTAANQPQVTGTVVSPAGGNLPAGILRITVTADDGSNNYTLPAVLQTVLIPDSSPPSSPPGLSSYGTGAVTLDVDWPGIPGLEQYTIYAGQHVDIVTAQIQDQPLVPVYDSPPSSPPVLQGYSPSTIMLTGGVDSPPASPPGLLRTFNPPAQTQRKTRIKGALIIHGGVVGDAIDSISGNSFFSHATIDLMGLDDWAGRVLMIIGRPNNLTVRIPLWTRNCTGFDNTTGEFSFDGVAISSPPGANDPQAGDVFIVCTLGYDNSSNPFELQDLGWKSAGNFSGNFVSTPHSGLVPNLETGTIVWVIAGLGRGLGANVLANTNDAHILDRALVIDSTSIWIIIENGWPYQTDSFARDNANPFLVHTFAIPIDNYDSQQVFLRGYLVDANGAESADSYGPYRMVYAPGQGLFVSNPGSATSPPTLDPSTQVVVVDTSGGAVSLILPAPALMAGRRIQLKKDSTLYPATFTTPEGTIT